GRHLGPDVLNLPLALRLVDVHGEWQLVVGHHVPDDASEVADSPTQQVVRICPLAPLVDGDSADPDDCCHLADTKAGGLYQIVHFLLLQEVPVTLSGVSSREEKDPG